MRLIFFRRPNLAIFLLRDGLVVENAWELEIFGGARTDKYERWFASERWNLPYYNVVIKGKIEPLALSRLRAMRVMATT